MECRTHTLVQSPDSSMAFCSSADFFFLGVRLIGFEGLVGVVCEWGVLGCVAISGWLTFGFPRAMEWGVVEEDVKGRELEKVFEFDC